MLKKASKVAQRWTKKDETQLRNLLKKRTPLEPGRNGEILAIVNEVIKQIEPPVAGLAKAATAA